MTRAVFFVESSAPKTKGLQEQIDEWQKLNPKAEILSASYGESASYIRDAMASIQMSRTRGALLLVRFPETEE